MREVRNRRNVLADANTPVKIIPLGGLEQIGMNITAIEYDRTIIVVDCGLSFPDDDMLGIDLVIPDVSYLIENKDRVKGLVITHGHEDHIGSIPYIEKQLNMPIYATKLTMGLIEYKLEEHGLQSDVQREVVSYGQTVNFGQIQVEFIRTNHSIADSAALAIFTPAGVIVHTGDFKVDYTPVFGGVIDLQRFAELGKQGVLALMADSTNVTREGFTPSERTVGKTFDHVFDENRDHRMIIATFASNVDRVQQIINSAYKYKRKVIVQGRSMVNVISIASELGYLTIPENTLIEIDEAKNYTDEQLVYITTGSQGENMAVLSRIAASIHNKISIKPGDVVIFSSSPIPGNEKAVYRVINELEQKGAKVIYHDAHVSGHACQEELKLIYALTKPRYAIPVHGEYRHLKRHAELAVEMGIPRERVRIVRCGDVLAVSEDVFEVIGHVQAQGVLVDGLGVGDVGNIVLRDRQHLSENGLIVVALTLEHGSNQLLAGPDIISRGFVYVRESESLLEDCRSVVEETLEECLARSTADWSRIKSRVRDELGEFLWKRTKRSPMILPIISEV
ncbi:MAG: ribonuclease J [Eubacterium sp.]|nr:ribonuclease J [Eubacterium sp.]